jgi:hypothetical protein
MDLPYCVVCSYSLPLEKLDRYVCLKASGLEDEAWLESDEEDDSDSDSDDSEGGRRRDDDEGEEGEAEGEEGVLDIEEEAEVDDGPTEYIIEEKEDGSVVIMTPAEKVRSATSPILPSVFLLPD